MLKGQARQAAEVVLFRAARVRAKGAGWVPPGAAARRRPRCSRSPPRPAAPAARWPSQCRRRPAAERFTVFILLQGGGCSGSTGGWQSPRAGPARPPVARPPPTGGGWPCHRSSSKKRPPPRRSPSSQTRGPGWRPSPAQRRRRCARPGPGTPCRPAQRAPPCRLPHRAAAAAEPLAGAGLLAAAQLVLAGGGGWAPHAAVQAQAAGPASWSFDRTKIAKSRWVDRFLHGVAGGGSWESCWESCWARGSRRDDDAMASASAVQFKAWHSLQAGGPSSSSWERLQPAKGELQDRSHGGTHSRLGRPGRQCPLGACQHAHRLVSGAV